MVVYHGESMGLVGGCASVRISDEMHMRISFLADAYLACVDEDEGGVGTVNCPVFAGTQRVPRLLYQY